jgi:PAS domain S-box-containing protein
MGIDIRTIITVLGITQLLQVLIFSYQYIVNDNIKGPGWWLLWSATEAVGLFIILLRNIPQLTFVVISLQDIIILLGMIFIYIGIIKFLGKKTETKLITVFFLIFVLIHLGFLIVTDNIVIRSFVLSIAISLISFFTAYKLFRYRTKDIFITANLNIVIFILHGSVFAYRAVISLSGNVVNDIFADTFYNLLPYADGIVVSLMWTFGFIIMLNQKLNSQISDANSQFELIFNASPEAAVISDLSDGTFLDCNETFTKLLGYTKEEMKGRSSLSVNLWYDPEVRKRLINILRSTGSCENEDVTFRKKNGELITGLFSGKLITIKEQDLMLSITHDITERKKADQEILLKNEELRKLNLEKDKLFSVIAHDLRNPFTALLGLTEVMVYDKKLSTEEMRQIAGDIHISSKKLYSLLENLLEWSRAEQGLIRYNPQVLNLSELIDESVSKSEDLAYSKNIGITTELSSGLRILADRNIFLTIMRNLLSNAVKFTAEGGKISIRAEMTNSGDVKISVSDTGIGMSKEIIDSLFSFDSQNNRPGTNGETSTGLGLMLCKGYIEKSGGSISVTSTPGNGSAFSFTIPQGN